MGWCYDIFPTFRRHLCAERPVLKMPHTDGGETSGEYRNISPRSSSPVTQNIIRSSIYFSVGLLFKCWNHFYCLPSSLRVRPNLIFLNYSSWLYLINGKNYKVLVIFFPLPNLIPIGSKNASIHFESVISYNKLYQNYIIRKKIFINFDISISKSLVVKEREKYFDWALTQIFYRIHPLFPHVCKFHLFIENLFHLIILPFHKN